MDDFLLFDDDKGRLWEMKRQIEQYLQSFRVVLKSNGVTLFRVSDGFPCFGYRVLSRSVAMPRAAILRFRRLVKRERPLWRRRRVTLSHLKCVVFGCMGHFTQADTTSLRWKLLEESYF